MEIVDIPIASDNSHFVQENVIFKKSFFLEFEWIENEQFWLLHILDAQQNPLALGIKLKPAWPLFAYYQASSAIIFSLHQHRQSEILNRLNLKTNFVLVAYVSAL